MSCHSEKRRTFQGVFFSHCRSIDLVLLSVFLLCTCQILRFLYFFLMQLSGLLIENVIREFFLVIAAQLALFIAFKAQKVPSRVMPGWRQTPLVSGSSSAARM
jgi:high-affinity nickel permease